MTFGSGSWAKLSFEAFSGEMKVDGDLFAVLGINTDKLTQSSDPFSMLPDSVARGLIEGIEITRDEELSVVIIPGKSGSSNTVVLIAEQIADIDLVADIAGGVVGFAPDGTILRWNLRMTHLFGPREKDVKGRKASDILPNPVLYNWDSVISSAHLGHEVRVEFKPSGEKRVDGVLSRGGPGVIGLFRDSTEDFKTSKRLRALNRLNQAYLQSSGTGLLLLDSRLRILLSNSGFSRITGHRGSLIGFQLHDILSEESYKWVHDASEHLLAEERADQSGIVSFTNQDGKLLTLRQTLRAVRNETNEALNYVCLFEDETDLIVCRDELDHLKKNFVGVSRISEEVVKSGHGLPGNICQELLRVTRSKAVAQYLYDSSESIKLICSAGKWPKGFPTEELGGLGFPAFVWGADKHYKIASVEMGKLSDFFRFCTVLPVTAGVSNQGYLVLAESELSSSDTDSELLQIVSSLIRIQSEIIRERSARSVAEEQLEQSEGFAETILDGIPLPLAILGMDGKVNHWNRAIEKVCGVTGSEVTGADISNLIDPDGSGYTLDSLAFGSNLDRSNLPMEWSVTRKDGSKSAVHRWTVSIVDTSARPRGDAVFLISGIPSNRNTSSVFSDQATSAPRSLYDKSLHEKIDKVPDSYAHTDALSLFSDVCFLICGHGSMEFRRDGEQKVVFTSPAGADESGYYSLEFRSSKSIFGKLYHIRTSSTISQEILDTVADLFSEKDAVRLKSNEDAEKIHEEICEYSVRLAGYLEQYSSASVEQNNAILNVIDKADPLAGFARTMLYSNEKASRVTQILMLSVKINRVKFVEESPDKFLTRLFGVFSVKGLRPPSLALEDKMPAVFFVPSVLPESFALLCQLVVPEAVVSFKARKSDNQEKPGVFLVMEGLNEKFQILSEADIHSQLESGRFSLETEAAILFRILEAAGCSLVSRSSSKLIFFLRSVL